MTNTPISLQCPDCLERREQQFTGAEIEGDISCVACGHTGNIEQFVDPDTRARIVDYAPSAAAEALKSVPGFKPEH